MNDHAVIIKPLLTEKTINARTESNKYYFQVHPKANKVMVKKALEKLFKVHVIQCNILNIKGKKIRTKHGFSYNPSHKKVVVTLKQDESFDFYEGI